MRADPEVLSSHARDVRDLTDDALLLVLDLPVAVALARVVATRGEDWFDAYVGFQARRGDDPLLEAATRYWEAFAPRRDDIVAAHAAAGWDVAKIDASRAAELVLRDALSAVRR